MNPFLSDDHFMKIALQEAWEAFQEDEVPVGAVITSGTKILAKTHNLTERLHDTTAHAEMLAITAATEALGSKYLPDCTIYVTLEPCIMCAGALGWSHIGRIVYGASDPKRGFTRFCSSGNSPLHPKTQITKGILEYEVASMMTEFFKRKR